MYRNEDYLGVTIPGVGIDTSIVGGLFKDSKDPGRLSGNATAYAAARAGNGEALKYLQGRSGRFGSVATTYTLGDKSPIGPWATKATQDDAWSKYQSIVAPQSTAQKITSAITGGPVIAGMSTGPLLVAGVAALGIYMLASNRR